MPLNPRKKLKQAKLVFNHGQSQTNKKRKKNSSDSETESCSKLQRSEEFPCERESGESAVKGREGVEEKENLKFLSNKLSDKTETLSFTHEENEDDVSDVNEVILLEESSKEDVLTKKVNVENSGRKLKQVKNNCKVKDSIKSPANVSLQEMFKNMETKKVEKICLNQEVIDLGSEDDASNSSFKVDKIEETSLTPHNQPSDLKNVKLTPQQKLKHEGRKKKQDEKSKLKMEREKLRKEQEAAKIKEKEERLRKKIEEKEAKEKEKEEKKLKREEERQKKEEKKEEERQKKVEEKQKKEEEKIKREEEKLQAEEEERERQEKLKAKFVQFFVPKKLEVNQTLQEIEIASGKFFHFQVKDNMKMAPLVRTSMSNERKKTLDKLLSCGYKADDMSYHNYIEEIKTQDYMLGRSLRTFPPNEKFEYEDDDDDCEILGSEIEDDENVFEEAKSSEEKSLVRAKFLRFCENNRPAYYGTWSKKPVNVNGRRPFGKEKILDYEYDSDEDWEEIENSESLSDSDGEGDEGAEEESNQYEVDNEFFVPHGYLSDGEGEDKDDECEDETIEEKNELSQKEKLKQKQEEFELELKQKTKQLKPKIFGCIWLGNKSSHKAYDQLLNILSPHEALMMNGNSPVETESIDCSNEDGKDDDDDEEEEESSKRFVKNFPERAIPDLIRLIHGNQNSKLFLMREFSEYWKKKVEGFEEDSPSSSGFIALRKIEPKIQEIGQYGKFSEDGISPRCRVWYVSKELRKKYGLENLSLANSWNYTLSPKSKRNDFKEEKNEEAEDEGLKFSNLKSPSEKTNLLTLFSRALNGDEKKKASGGSCSQDLDNEIAVIKENETPKRKTSSDLFQTPSPGIGGKRKKRRISLTTPVSKEKTLLVESPSRPSQRIDTLFKNIQKSKSGENSKRKNQNEESSSDFIINID